MYFAILPVVLESYLSTSTIWRLSAGLLGIWTLGLYIAWSLRFWPHLQEFPATWRKLSAANTVFFALQIIACLLVSAGRLSELQALIYLYSLLSLVLVGLVNFAYLLLTRLGDVSPR